MQELDFHAGEDAMVESFAPENRYGVVFEDDGETGYFYAVEKDADGSGLRVLDALHIYEGDEGPDEANEGVLVGEIGEVEDAGEAGADTDEEGEDAGQGGDSSEGDDGAKSHLQIVWSRDWLKCALVIDGFCQAIFDFEGQNGYNINEFPPANEFWSKGGRELTDEIIHRFF